MIRMNGPAAALIVGVTGNVMAHDIAHYIASGTDGADANPSETLWRLKKI